MGCSVNRFHVDTCTRACALTLRTINHKYFFNCIAKWLLSNQVLLPARSMRIDNRSMDSSRSFLKGVYVPYLHTSFELVGIYLTIWGVQIFSLRVNDGNRAGFCSVLSEDVQV